MARAMRWWNHGDDEDYDLPDPVKSDPVKSDSDED